MDSTSYSYDNNGNLTGDGIYSYDYDCENRLIEVTGGGSAIAKYYYDYAGRRIAKVAANTETTYHYDGPQVIAEYENGTLKRKFIYGPGIDEPIIMIDVVNGDYYFYHFDGLGSVVALSDENGDIVERYEYSAFGQTQILSPSYEPRVTSDYSNPYMFTGRRLDDETGLYYYRARYYSPELGRFMQPDPVGYIGGINLYTYCRNNPARFVDPFGLISFGQRLFIQSAIEWLDIINESEKFCLNQDGWRPSYQCAEQAEDLRDHLNDRGYQCWTFDELSGAQNPLLLPPGVLGLKYGFGYPLNHTLSVANPQPWLASRRMQPFTIDTYRSIPATFFGLRGVRFGTVDMFNIKYPYRQGEVLNWRQFFYNLVFED